jgi:hypothetical protein
VYWIRSRSQVNGISGVRGLELGRSHSSWRWSANQSELVSEGVEIGIGHIEVVRVALESEWQQCRIRSRSHRLGCSMHLSKSSSKKISLIVAVSG